MDGPQGKKKTRAKKSGERELDPADPVMHEAPPTVAVAAEWLDDLVARAALAATDPAAPRALDPGDPRVENRLRELAMWCGRKPEVVRCDIKLALAKSSVLTKIERHAERVREDEAARAEERQQARDDRDAAIADVRRHSERMALAEVRGAVGLSKEDAPDFASAMRALDDVRGDLKRLREAALQAFAFAQREHEAEVAEIDRRIARVQADARRVENERVKLANKMRAEERRLASSAGS